MSAARKDSPTARAVGSTDAAPASGSAAAPVRQAAAPQRGILSSKQLRGVTVVSASQPPPPPPQKPPPPTTPPPPSRKATTGDSSGINASAAPFKPPPPSTPPPEPKRAVLSVAGGSQAPIVPAPALGASAAVAAARPPLSMAAGATGPAAAAAAAAAAASAASPNTTAMPSPAGPTGAKALTLNTTATAIGTGEGEVAPITPNHMLRKSLAAAGEAVAEQASRLKSSSRVVSYAVDRFAPVVQSAGPFLAKRWEQFGDPLLTRIDSHLDSLLVSIDKQNQQNAAAAAAAAAAASASVAPTPASASASTASTPAATPYAAAMPDAAAAAAAARARESAALKEQESAYWANLKRKFEASRWYHAVDSILLQNSVFAAIHGRVSSQLLRPAELFYGEVSELFMQHANTGVDGYLAALKQRMGTGWDERLTGLARAFYNTARTVRLMVGAGKFVGGALQLGKAAVAHRVTSAIDQLIDRWDSLLIATDDAPATPATARFAAANTNSTLIATTKVPSTTGSTTGSASSTPQLIAMPSAALAPNAPFDVSALLLGPAATASSAAGSGAGARDSKQQPQSQHAPAQWASHALGNSLSSSSSSIAFSASSADSGGEDGDEVEVEDLVHSGVLAFGDDVDARVRARDDADADADANADANADARDAEAAADADAEPGAARAARTGYDSAREQDNGSADDSGSDLSASPASSSPQNRSPQSRPLRASGSPDPKSSSGSGSGSKRRPVHLIVKKVTKRLRGRAPGAAGSGGALSAHSDDGAAGMSGWMSATLLRGGPTVVGAGVGAGVAVPRDAPVRDALASAGWFAAADAVLLRNALMRELSAMSPTRPADHLYRTLVDLYAAQYGPIAAANANAKAKANASAGAAPSVGASASASAAVAVSVSVSTCASGAWQEYVSGVQDKLGATWDAALVPLVSQFHAAATAAVANPPVRVGV